MLLAQHNLLVVVILLLHRGRILLVGDLAGILLLRGLVHAVAGAGARHSRHREHLVEGHVAGGAGEGLRAEPGLSRGKGGSETDTIRSQSGQKVNYNDISASNKLTTCATEPEKTTYRIQTITTN